MLATTVRSVKITNTSDMERNKNLNNSITDALQTYYHLRCLRAETDLRSQNR